MQNDVKITILNDVDGIDLSNDLRMSSVPDALISSDVSTLFM